MCRQIHLIVLTSLFFINITAQVQFVEHVIDNNTHGMGGVYSCDVDSDGVMDILAASIEDNQILWFRNDGGSPISWEKITIGAGVGSAHSVYAADIDGDNDMDVVGAAYIGRPGIAWWRNEGGDPVVWTKFTVANSFINAHEVYCSDVDGDGAIDILGASSDLNKIAWWHNDGGNPISWTQQTLGSNITLAKSVTTGDIDGDNDMDIIGVSIINNDVICWRNDGGDPIQWTKLLVDNNFYGAHRVQTIDMDNDGDIDIVGAAYLGNQVTWWRNDGGTPVVWTSQIIDSRFSKACVAYAVDLDNDNDMDVIGTGQGINQIAWWRNDGGSPITWTKNIVQSNFTRPWPLYSCDVDGDGDNDIISGSSHNGNNIIAWWETTIITNAEDQSEATPIGFELKQNYPNPFNPSTQIQFTINKNQFVELNIFDMTGRKVDTLLNKELSAGSYNIEWNPPGFSSGIYLCSLSTGKFKQSKKMILLK